MVVAGYASDLSFVVAGMDRPYASSLLLPFSAPPRLCGILVRIFSQTIEGMQEPWSERRFGCWFGLTFPSPI